MRLRRVLGITTVTILTLSTVAAATLLFPDPIARMLVRAKEVQPFPDQPDVEVRVSRHLLNALSLLFLAAGGEPAAALTVGHTILIRPEFTKSSAYKPIIAHELGHVVQAERFGASYLPRYILAFRPGQYNEHPLELEAEAYARALLHRTEPRVKRPLRYLPAPAKMMDAPIPAALYSPRALYRQQDSPAEIHPPRAESARH